MTSGSVAVADDDGILSSLRYLFADFLGDDDDTPPFLPEALPERLSPVVSDAIHLLIDVSERRLRQALCRPPAALHRQARRQ